MKSNYLRILEIELSICTDPKKRLELKEKIRRERLALFLQGKLNE